MRKKSLLICLLGGCVALNSYAQKQKTSKGAAKTPVAVETPAPKPNPMIFTYGDDTVFKNEFERLLNKNRKDKAAPTEKEVREYLELYINFKLKVKEALNMEMDTNPTFRSELGTYRKQLANPYLTDKKVTESLMQEAYDRMKTEVNASHILVNCPANASPADTLAAFKKISDLRKRVLSGENFDSVGVKYSDDPSAKKNHGKLGWFSAFSMIYPFENMAYTTPVGEISMPFRTQYGYHIMRVNARRPARGDVKVGHIMLRTGYGATKEQIENARLTADSIYDRLQKGESFETLAEKYSQDEASKSNKGIMNWMPSLSGYPEEFKDTCFNLQPGTYSKPFQTDYGFHIVKYMDKRPLAEYKDLQETIKSKVNRDSRSESSKASVVARIKKENNYREYPQNLKLFALKLDSSFLKGAWTYDTSKISDAPLMSIGDKTYGEKEFASYVKANQQSHSKESANVIASNMFRQWADDKCMAYEESNLEKKYEDFRNIIQEYHDGILLFDLTDKKVWSRAVSDTMGLEKFYEGNKEKYQWKERVKYNTYTCVDAKTKAEVIAMLNKGKSEDEVISKFNKKMKGSVMVKENKAEKTDATGEKLWDKKGVVDIPNEVNSFKFYYVVGTIAPEQKTLKEAKGMVTSDYQNYLEKEWVKELRSKYPVTVAEQNLQLIYNK